MVQKAKKEYEEADKKEQQQMAGVFGKNNADYNGALHVNGARLLNQYNEEIQLNGLHYGSGNSAYSIKLLSALKNNGVNLIKIGYNYSGSNNKAWNIDGNMDKMFQLIDVLIEQDFYIDIIYWSDGNLYEEGYDKTNEAIEYFSKIANKYPNDYHILYEICNEPYQNTWEEVEIYANNIITEIRKISPNSIISVPTNDNNFNEVFLANLLSFDNIMYVTHIYAGDEKSVASMNYAINNNIPVFISEWSNVNAFATDYNNELTDYLIYIINHYKIANSAWYFDESKKIDSDFTMINKKYWEDALRTGKISDKILGISGKYYFDFTQGVNKGKQRVILKKYMEGTAFWQEEYRTNTTKIIFENEITMPQNIIEVWDVSDDNSKSVIAYIIDDGKNNNTYELHICGNNKQVGSKSLLKLFLDFNKLEYIDITQLDTSKVTSMAYMFENCSNLNTIIGLNVINTSNVISMREMFKNCEKLEELNLSNFNTSNVNSMEAMFWNCNELQELDLKNFNTSNVTTMSYMFLYCRKLQTIELSSFDTSKVTTMSYMFGACNNLNSLNLSSFNTSCTTTMNSMFEGAGLYSTNFELKFGNNFNTSNVTNMNKMFESTGRANKSFVLDLTNFTFKSGLNYTNIFAYIPETTTVYVKNSEMQQFVIEARGGNVWSTSNVIIK